MEVQQQSEKLAAWAVAKKVEYGPTMMDDSIADDQVQEEVADDHYIVDTGLLMMPN